MKRQTKPTLESRIRDFLKQEDRRCHYIKYRGRRLLIPGCWSNLHGETMAMCNCAPAAFSVPRPALAALMRLVDVVGEHAAVMPAPVREALQAVTDAGREA